MWKQEFNHLIKLHDFIESGEKFKILNLDCNTQRQFVFSFVNTVVDTEVDDVSVLLLLLGFLCLSLTVLDIFFNALVD